jgi:Tfp pilus assembly protein PilF
MPPSAPRQPAPATPSIPVRLAAALLVAAALVAGCARDRGEGSAGRSRDAVADSLAEAPSPPFRNVAGDVAYAGDSSCVGCHADAARAYHQRSMSRSMHRWTRAVQVESTLVAPIVHQRTGFRYVVVEDRGRLWQVEFLEGAGGKRTHELRRPMDWVVGSGRVARTYFTEENGRLTQLPLTWYHSHGWDFSPGYELTNLRFDRVLPDRCVACHSSYPVPKPYLEGKYAELRPGIGCERCHGPGALHVAERRAGGTSSGSYDATIVNPAKLPVERRLDVCEQCHVHADVELPREGRGSFGYVPSQRLSDYYAFYKKSGAIDVVSHADRLRQSACFLATRRSVKPLECATCHDPHDPSESGTRRDDACLGCHEVGVLSKKLEKSPEVVNHSRPSDCVSCHMPTIRERTVPHGTFTEHWIRVPDREDGERTTPGRAAAPIEAYYARDRAGPASRIYLGMGEVMHATQTNDRRALAAAAATLDAALGRDTTRGDALFLLGIAWEQLGDTARATDVLQRALAVDPRRPEALRALAQAHLRAGRTSVADSLYRRALAAQPALAWVRAEYADLLLAAGQSGRAIAEYRRAVAEQPDLAVAWFNLGAALMGVGQRATDPFGRAVTLDPSLGDALSHLVRVTVAADSVTEARTLPAPLPSLPVRDAGARAVRLLAGSTAEQGIAFTGIPAYGLVQILRPDGTVLRTLSDGGAQSVVWDLRTEAGLLAGGGLYRARIVARDRSGRPAPAGMVAFGVVRDE